MNHIISFFFVSVKLLKSYGLPACETFDFPFPPTSITPGLFFPSAEDYEIRNRYCTV